MDQDIEQECHWVNQPKPAGVVIVHDKGRTQWVGSHWLIDTTPVTVNVEFDDQSILRLSRTETRALIFALNEALDEISSAE